MLVSKKKARLRNLLLLIQLIRNNKISYTNYETWQSQRQNLKYHAKNMNGSRKQIEGHLSSSFVNGCNN